MLVSVIITTYNRKIKYIKRAVDSVLRQTYSNIEIIIVDDNVDINYRVEVQHYCRNKGIKYIMTSGKKGANYGRNLGAINSKGDYLAFLDDDDRWLPNKIELQLKCFNNPKIGMVYSNGYVINKKTKILYTDKNHFINTSNIYYLLIYNYVGPTVTALIKRNCFFEVGMFDENLHAKQDYDLWIRLCEKYILIGINIPLYYYYQHKTMQITKNYKMIFYSYNYLFKKYSYYYKRSKVLRFFYYLKISKIFKLLNKRTKHFYYLLLAFKELINTNLNVIY